MQARNAEFTEATRQQISELERLGWYHSIQLPDGQVIKGFQSLENLRFRLAQFPVPEDLTGKRVLDIGAWDGWFSFEMERRGAEVVAVDSSRQERFFVARDLLGSRVEHRVADICRLSPKDIGYFDIVLFFGVLYHVKHPLLALENVCSLSTSLAFVESYVTDNGDDLTCPPVMEFYETTELRGQFDNWVGPNTSCLVAFCRTAGFARTRLESVIQNRAHVTCYRKWDEPSNITPAPFLVGVLNADSRSQEVSTGSDDYLSFWFKSGAEALTADNTFPQIGPYGSRPVHVARTEADGWHLNCKLPPGLLPGWHEVSLRVGDSERSNLSRLAVDVPADYSTNPPSVRPSIHLIADGNSWERYRVRTGPHTSISLWAAGLPEDVHAGMVSVLVNGISLPASFVSCEDAHGLRQVNALLTASLQTGPASVAVVSGAVASDPVQVELLPAVDTAPE